MLRKMPLIDSHCHLDLADFSADLPETLQRARASGVSDIVIPAIAASGWPNLAAIAGAHSGIHTAYGLHPVFLAEHHESHLAALPDWLARPECVAVGECGLDFFESHLDVAHQERIFIAHIQLAKQFNKALIIHARKATERVMQLLKQYGPVRGVIHSYSGSLEQARQLVAMGFMLGIGGALTYPRSNRLRAIVQEIALQHLLIETDAPDQPMCGEQGRRNEPSKLVRVAEAMADIRGMRLDEVAKQTTQNASQLFALPN
jgi:TatD DNase family protein